MADILKWIWLSLRCGAGSKYYDTLLRQFGDVEKIYCYNGDYKDKGISPKLASRLSDKCLEDAKSVLDFCSLNSISVLTLDSDEYPSRLKALKDPPGVLYYKGTLPHFDEKLCLAIVGTRDITEYGERMAYNISYGSANAGAIVVSGMARGIDGVAAAAAIEAKGVTVAVLGSGLDVIYPPEHRTLMKRILKEGAVISEYPPGTPPERKNFPLRNRIISGLCQGTVVVEGDYESGALITAEHAKNQGRDVFAVPGMVGVEASEGTNLLIKNGAHMATSAFDVLAYYERYYPDVIDISRSVPEKYASNFEFAKQNVLGWIGKGKLRRSFAPKSENKPINTEIKKETSCVAHKTSDLPVDEKEKRLASLGDNCVSVYRALPCKAAITVDRLSDCGLDSSKIMSALTLLEINGLVAALPGGLYVRT